MADFKLSLQLYEKIEEVFCLIGDMEICAEKERSSCMDLRISNQGRKS